MSKVDQDPNASLSIMEVSCPLGARWAERRCSGSPFQLATRSLSKKMPH